ncbi:hypothetical protein [Treponema sp.]|uniref:hypothetical protein n=1 Tax=Treponema sp. TaxID=166 RepID=UPI003F0E2F7E
MGIANFVKNFFYKSKRKNQKSGLLDRIHISMELLVQKSENLNSQFNEEKKQIEELALEAGKIVSSDEIFSAKLEQDILGNITAVSSACDSALSGGNNSAVKEALASLKTVISQRIALK